MYTYTSDGRITLGYCVISGHIEYSYVQITSQRENIHFTEESQDSDQETFGIKKWVILHRREYISFLSKQTELNTSLVAREPNIL